ncbi:hypothetical protein HY479_02830 [Candidatus Uhrbacteria bacterium]|nr:hypothetical protein [Candidatus Uhrbacteria bacterium]
MPKERREKKPSLFLTEYYSTSFFLMILAFIVPSMFVLVPRMDAIKRTNAGIEADVRQLAQEQAYLGSLEQSIEAAKRISPAILDRALQALPRDPDLPELLVLFGGLSDLDGVKIMNVTFAEERAAPTRGRTAATSTIQTTQINLSVAAANYPQIKRFLRHVESSLRLLDIVGINVTLKGEESMYAIQLKTYASRPPTAAATAQKR